MFRICVLSLSCGLVSAAVGDVRCSWMGSSSVTGSSICQDPCLLTGLQTGGNVAESATPGAIDFSIAQLPTCAGGLPPTISLLASTNGVYSATATVQGIDAKAVLTPIDSVKYSLVVSASLVVCRTTVTFSAVNCLPRASATQTKSVSISRSRSGTRTSSRTQTKTRSAPPQSKTQKQTPTRTRTPSPSKKKP